MPASVARVYGLSHEAVLTSDTTNSLAGHYREKRGGGVGQIFRAEKFINLIGVKRDL